MFALRAFNFLFLWNWLSCHSLTESALSQTCIILIQWNKKCPTFGWCLLQTSGVAGWRILSYLAACVTCQVTSCPLRLERLTDTASQDRERSLAWTLPLARQSQTSIGQTEEVLHSFISTEYSLLMLERHDLQIVSNYIFIMHRSKGHNSLWAFSWILYINSNLIYLRFYWDFISKCAHWARDGGEPRVLGAHGWPSASLGGDGDGEVTVLRLVTAATLQCCRSAVEASDLPVSGRSHTSLPSLSGHAACTFASYCQ